jgi:hypothetical protein
MADSPNPERQAGESPKRISPFDDLTWRTLPITAVERSALKFGGEAGGQLDPTLFPRKVALTDYGYQPLGEGASREDRLKEVALFAGRSFAHAFKSFKGVQPEELEESLRAHLAGIIEAFSEIDPAAVSSVVHSFYVIERDLRFLEQARNVPGGREAFEARHNLICDEMGVDFVRDGLFETLVESKLFALRGFLDVTEGLIKRAHRVAGLSRSLEEIQGHLDAASPGLGETIRSVTQHPFAVIVNCVVGSERSLIDELDLGGRVAGRLKKEPHIIVVDEGWASSEYELQRDLRGVIAESVADHFTRPCWAEAKGTFSFKSEREFILYMLFGEDAP